MHRTPTTDRLQAADPRTDAPPSMESPPDPEPQRGADVSFDPWGGRLERTLRQAIPSLVHRLNNALGPVTGFTSVAVRARQPLAVDRAAVVAEQAERAVSLTRALSEVSKGSEGDAELVDLVEWLREAEDFLDGCVEGFAAGVRLRLQPPSAPVRVSTRPLFQMLFVGLVEAAAVGARDLEIALVSAGSDAVLLELRARDLGPALPPVIGELAGAVALERLEIAPEEMVLRARFATLEPVDVGADADVGPHIVVVERDPFLREEVEQVLIEQGYRVTAHERSDAFDPASHEGRPAAYLVDSVTASTPSIGDLLDRAPAPLCVMGTASAPLDPNWPQLPKPFRPGELLERVAALVAR